MAANFYSVNSSPAACAGSFPWRSLVTAAWEFLERRERDA